jgi:hypothetical protein
MLFWMILTTLVYIMGYPIFLHLHAARGVQRGEKRKCIPTRH